MDKFEFMERKKGDHMEEGKIILTMLEYLKESIKFSQNQKATPWGDGVEFGLKCALDHLEFLIKLYKD